MVRVWWYEHDDTSIWVWNGKDEVYSSYIIEYRKVGSMGNRQE